MTNVTRYSVRVIGINLAALIVIGLVAFYFGDKNGGSLLFAFIFYFISVFIQLIVGIVLLVDERQREWGKAMLISMGIILLVGFSVCSVAVRFI